MVTATLNRVLDVYLRDKFVGKLFSEKANLSFVYNKKYLQKNYSQLSVSLPLQEEPFPHELTAPFFSGLLPDERVRHHLARYLKISAKNIFALLKEIGGECAGAVSVYPEGTTPETKATPSHRILDDSEANLILSSLDKHPLLAGEKGIRLSGAGAQEKLMIAFVDNKIAIPTGNTPSTHIIKPSIKELRDSVHNEFFCMSLAKAVGLPVPLVEIYWLMDKPYYLIERYDRRNDQNGVVTRIHQEDFCQAMHIPPELKYEAEGGPTLTQCFALLDARIRSGLMAGNNKLVLLRAVIFNFLIGNGDAHAKNFSLLYEGQAESLAPLYDLLSTIVYDETHKAKMAMKISGQYRFKAVMPRHWEQLAKDLGMRPDYVKKQILLLANQITKWAALLSLTFNQNPKTASPIYKKIIKIISKNVAQILAH